MLKAELRERIRMQKRQFAGISGELSLLCVSRLLSHPRIVAARTVLMYCSLPDEVGTHDALDRLVEMGKRVLLPQVTGRETMCLRVYRGRDDLREGAFHISEPQGPVFTAYDEVDVAVVPGMAFDRNGHRLGRGRGYYDRLLPQLPYAYKIGACFDFQKVDEVPTNPFDVVMDEVL